MLSGKGRMDKEPDEEESLGEDESPERNSEKRRVNVVDAPCFRLRAESFDGLDTDPETDKGGQDGRTVKRAMLNYHSTTANEVLVCGSFTGWEPIGMLNAGRGLFHLVDTIDIPTGFHLFYFMVDGERTVDTEKPSVRNEEGIEYNTVSFKSGDCPEFATIGWHLVNEEVSPRPRVSKKSSYRSLSSRLFLNQFMLPGVINASTSKLNINNNSEFEDGNESHSDVMKPKHPRYDDTTRALLDRKLLIIMVGLPARGKSFVSRKLCRYLNWLGYICKVFNLGVYRRELLPGFHEHNFFSSDNPEGKKMREKFAEMAMSDALKFLALDGGGVAILDGTNSTIKRRMFLMDLVKTSPNHSKMSLKTMFLEIICNDETVIRKNVLATKTRSPDYVSIEDKTQVVEDFMQRIQHYEDTYQPVGACGEDRSYIKIVDVGRQTVTNRIYGYLPTRVLLYVSNLHALPRPIYICRHGESEYNLDDRLGGDPNITKRGEAFATALYGFFKKQGDAETMSVWSSTMLRTIQTANLVKDLAMQYIQWKALDEIDVGICDGMTYQQVEKEMPDEFIARKKDKLRYRYPRGESYEDLVRRVEPVIMEIERTRRPILCVCHRAVARCLYAYLTDCTQQEMPLLDMPLHTVFKITPHAYGTKVKRFVLTVDDPPVE